MSADGFQPPDLVFVIKRDAVGLVGAVLLQKRAETRHTLPRGADVGQHEDDDVLFTDTTAAFFFTALRLAQLDQRVSRKHAGVRGYGFRCGHADICGVDAGRGPDAALWVHAGAGRVAHGIVRQFNFHMGFHALIGFGLLLGIDHDHPLFIKVSIVRSGDRGRTVIRRQPAGQHSCTGHSMRSPFLFLLRAMLRGLFSVHNYRNRTRGCKEKYSVPCAAAPAAAEYCIFLLVFRNGVEYDK